MRKVLITFKTPGGDQSYRIEQVKRIWDDEKTCRVEVEDSSQLYVLKVLEPFVRIRVRIDRGKELKNEQS